MSDVQKCIVNNFMTNWTAKITDYDSETPFMNFILLHMEFDLRKWLEVARR